MSMDAIRWAMAQDTDGPTTKMVLLALADFADDEKWSCWPSQEAISAKVCAAARTVRRGLKDLESARFIRRSKRSTGAGRSSDYYTLNPAENKQPDNMAACSNPQKSTNRTNLPVGQPDNMAGSDLQNVENPQKSTNRTNWPLSQPDNMAGSEKSAETRRNQPTGQIGQWPDCPGNPLIEYINKIDSVDSGKPTLEVVNAAFEEFWKAYPSRRPATNPKAPAKRKFTALIKAGVEPQAMVRGAERYQAYVDVDRTEPKYIVQATRFLNERRWEDYEEDPPDLPAPTMTIEEIRADKAARHRAKMEG